MSKVGRPIGKLHQEDVRFYVYQIVDGDEVVYIGKGSGRRNKVQERKFQLPCQIIERFKSEEAAYSKEVELIASLKPKLNKHVGGNGCRAKAKQSRPDKWTMFVNRYGSKRYAAALALAYGRSVIHPSKMEQLRQVANG